MHQFGTTREQLAEVAVAAEAEDGSGRLVFRLYESAGARVIADLSFGGTVSEAREVRALSLCARSRNDPGRVRR